MLVSLRYVGVHGSRHIAFTRGTIAGRGPRLRGFPRCLAPSIAIPWMASTPPCDLFPVGSPRAVYLGPFSRVCPVAGPVVCLVFLGRVCLVGSGRGSPPGPVSLWSVPVVCLPWSVPAGSGLWSVSLWWPWICLPCGLPVVSPGRSPVLLPSLDRSSGLPVYADEPIGSAAGSPRRVWPIVSPVSPCVGSPAPGFRLS